MLWIRIYGRNKLLFLLSGACLTVMFCCGPDMQAQSPDYPDSETEAFLDALEYQDNGWMQFRQGTQFTATDLFTTYKSFFGLGVDDAMTLISDQRSADGPGRKIYQQTYKGMKIDGAECILHVKDGFVYRVNGKLMSGLNLNVTPALAESAALAAALAHVNANAYGWDDIVTPNGTIPGSALTGDSIICWDAGFDTVFVDDDSLLTLGYITIGNDRLYIQPDSTVIFPDSIKVLFPGSAYPTGDLKIGLGEPGLQFQPSNLRLLYHFVIVCRDPWESYDVYVDAQTGAVLSKTKIGRHSTGDVDTFYNGNQSLTTKWKGVWPWQRFITWDDGRKFRTRRYFNHPNGITLEEHRAYNNHFTSGQKDRKGGGGHWAIQESHDYFKNNHGRNGHTGFGNRWINVFFNDAPSCNAAFTHKTWDNHDIIQIGTKSASCNEFIALDVMGHEFTHAVAAFAVSGGFEYSGESGALDESFADIFGAMVEFEVEGANGDWKIGEDLGFGIDTERTLKNPNSSGGGGATLGQPSSYMQSGYWYTGNDQGKVVHINSGVQNHWFYLLAEGGTLNGHTVSGIGKTKAAAIAYHNLTHYMQKYSQYSDAKTGAIYSAMDLYGYCSNEVRQTINAWNAVLVNGGNSILWDRAVNATVQNITHLLGFTYTGHALGVLTSKVSAIPNKTTLYRAGERINLLPGFATGGGNNVFFNARIFTCNLPLYKAGSPQINSQDDAIVFNPLPGIRPNNLALTVYPNPGNGQYTLQIAQLGESNLREHSTEYTIEIHDLFGKVVKHMTHASDAALQIDIRDQVAGMYTLTVRCPGFLQTIQLIKL